MSSVHSDTVLFSHCQICTSFLQPFNLFRHTLETVLSSVEHHRHVKSRTCHCRDLLLIPGETPKLQTKIKRARAHKLLSNVHSAKSEPISLRAVENPRQGRSCTHRSPVTQDRGPRGIWRAKKLEISNQWAGTNITSGVRLPVEVCARRYHLLYSSFATGWRDRLQLD